MFFPPVVIHKTSSAHGHIGWGLVLGIVAVSQVAVAQRPRIQALRIEQDPVIDGRLTEPCWQQAAVLRDFTQVEPVEGNAPSEETEIRFLFSQSSLLIGIHCLDSNPNQIIATQMQHDGDLDADDMVLLAFDTFNRQRDGYAFGVNPIGARAEGLIEDFTEVNTSWDTVWQARAHINGAGWTAEIAIPFTSLSFDPKNDRWGCNVERVIRRKQEVVRWTAPMVTKEVTLLSEFGEIVGLEDLHQGIGLELKPSVTVKYRDPSLDPPERWESRPGGDVTYYVTPALKVQGTVNTDFAEAEVDQRTVNLTRFPLFFPEKRDFFLQDSSLFNFGGLDEGLLPYYSRRIGLSESGAPIDIRYGGRLTGRANGTSMALLDVMQDGAEGADPSNLFVGRVTHRILKESNLGLIATNGDPRYNMRNTLGGFDFNYLNTRLADDKQLIGRAWFMATDSEHRNTTDTAFGGDLDWPNEPFDCHLFFRQIGDDFDPAMGYVRRRGIREYIASFRYVWRPNRYGIRRISLGTRPEVTTNLDDRVVAEDHSLVYVYAYSQAKDRFGFFVTLDSDRLEEPFEMVPNVVIPTGNYRYTQFRPFFYSSDARPFSAGFSFAYGDYYTGRRTYYRGLLDWRPSRYVTTGLETSVRHVRLPEGDFNVYVTGYRLNLSFTPDINWNTWVQYDNLSEDLGINSRWRWTYRPGSDLYLVANQGWDIEEKSHWRRLSTEITMKVGATFRF